MQEDKWETITETEDPYELTQGLPVPGGSLIRIIRRFSIKNQYGETQALVFVPDSLFTRFKNFLRGLWK